MGEHYPILVFSESYWGAGWYPTPNVVWAVRGSPLTVRPYGNSTTSPGEALARMGMYDAPGPNVRFTLSSAPPGALALLALGWLWTSHAGQSLPLSLAPVGFPGITVRTSLDACILTTTGTTGIAGGYASHDLPMQMDYAGTPAFAQWHWLDPTNLARHGSTTAHAMLGR